MSSTPPRRAKIVATLGPSSSSPQVLRDLIISGMNVARLNFSHGSHDDHQRMYELIRATSREVGIPVAILQDLQGPKIRVGKFAKGGTELTVGQRFCITAEDIEGNDKRVSTTYEQLPEDVKPGDVLLIDDGLLTLRVVKVDGLDVHTEVEVGGTLKNNKGINLPGAAVTAPSMTVKDKEDLAFGLNLGVDYVALSFVRSALDVHMLRALMAGRERMPLIISKIEKPQAVESLDDIIAISDGIMIARGDLGVEMPPEQVPLIQKTAIRKAISRRRLTITATQMLDSMTYNPRPTRAEASDVANAILDGTDAVMLSGETASGSYPIESVKMMSRIICEVERSPQYARMLNTDNNIHHMRTFPNAVAHAATVAAEELNVKAIVAFTSSGSTARLLTTYRPMREIVACTPNPDVLHQMALFWGVTPMLIGRMENTDDLIVAVERLMLRERQANPGDELLILMGTPVATGAETNLIKFHRLAETSALFSADFPNSRW